VVHITSLAAQRDLFSLRVQQVPSGTGSGFIWDANGHIVTNFHVIQGSSGASVTLADQSTWKASLVGAFPDRDLAVLKIDAPKDKLPPIALGTSRDLQVGQQVYAIGNPFGLDQTLTRGIVSALNREIESVNDRTIRGVIQTDAAINPGNSGGPLLDSAGRLIGVNTQIASPSGASAGIGFAIPVDEVNRIVPRLIRDGRFVRPAIGVTAGSASLQRALNLPEGIPLVQVQANGPAGRAGLQPFRRGSKGDIIAGDVITAVADQPVKNLDDLLSVMERRQSGEQVALTVWRAGQSRKVTLTLASGESAHALAGIEEHLHPGAEVVRVSPAPAHLNVSKHALGVRHHGREATVGRGHGGEPLGAAIGVEGIHLGRMALMVHEAHRSMDL
jgi:S1-C subfamily serine protease